MLSILYPCPVWNQAVQLHIASGRNPCVGFFDCRIRLFAGSLCVEVCAAFCLNAIPYIGCDVRPGSVRHVKAAMDDTAGIWYVYTVFMCGIPDTLSEKCPHGHRERQAG